MKINKLLNWRELSRLLTGFDGNIRFGTPIPQKYWGSIDNLILVELPAWWDSYKQKNIKK